MKENLVIVFMLVCIYVCILNNCTVKKIKENGMGRSFDPTVRTVVFYGLCVEERVVLITEWNTR